MTHCQHDQFRESVSPLSGRRLHVNESKTLFLVPKSLDLEKLRADVHEAINPVTGPSLREMRAEGAFRVWDKWSRLQKAQSIEEVVAILNSLIAFPMQSKCKKRRRCVRYLLTRLWADGHLAFPAGPPKKNDPIPKITSAVLGRQYSWIKDLVDGIPSDYPPSRKNYIVRTLFRLIMSTAGFESVGDLCTATVSSRLLSVNANARAFRFFCAYQKQFFSQADVAAVRRDWSRRNLRTLSDPEFRWVSSDVSMEEWRVALAGWVEQSSQKRRRIHFGNRLLKELTAMPDRPATPLQFLRVGTSWSERIRGSLANTSPENESRLVKYAHELSEWILNSYARGPSETYRNPFTRILRPALGCETHRMPVPTLFVRELIEILRSEWPKRLRTDYIEVVQDGGLKKVWSPVRASAVLLMLMLPLRGQQVRLLQTDEGDTLRLVDGEWVRNILPTAPPEGRLVSQSFLRRFTCPATGRDDVGFFVNTSKNAKRSRDGQEKGYEIPWSYDAVFRVVQDLAAWQLTYNPLATPLQWESLTDLRTVLDGAPRKGPACFLLRDPCGTVPNEPLSPWRLDSFWLALLDKLEQLLEKRGQVLLDGSPIRLITSRTSSGRPLRAAFDLHSLRVTLITALATEGGVPLHILSKSIAGHASVAMTLYYVKLSPDHMTSALKEAGQRIEAAEQANFLRYLGTVEREKRKAYVSNSDAGPAALDASTSVAWSKSEIGLCPVGGTQCDKGGPMVDGKTQPTPGRPRNCLRCRFFITGPAFLPGLVSRFNALSVRLTAVAEEYREAVRASSALDHAFTLAREQGKPFSDVARFETALQRTERATLDVDEVAHDWHSCFALIERTKAAMAQSASSPGTSLVLGGTQSDLTTALRETTELELMNAVCQDADIYPCPEVEIARLRRGRVLQAVLAGTPHARAFACLSREESLQVGNAVSKLLLAKFKAEDLEAAAAGKKMLDASGLTDSVATLLAHAMQLPAVAALPDPDASQCGGQV